VDKDDARVEALGDLDEANCAIGLLRCKLPPDHDWEVRLRRIQSELMELMGVVATPLESRRDRVAASLLESACRLEEWMQEIEDSLKSATENFLLPGGSEVSATCHLVRTVVRRAERRLVTLDRADPLDYGVIAFVNRLSDLFFKLSRQEMQRQGYSEERWRPFVPDRGA